MKWGITGTGKIARRFTESLKLTDDAEATAVVSGRTENAVRFAREFNIPQVHNNVQEMAESDVDIIYIGTPHHLHYQQTLTCLNAGKHVLCEKPITITARQTEHLIYTARKKGVFLMEAMWTHFLPAHQTVQSWIQNDQIGNIISIDYSFGFNARKNSNHRLFNPEMGGGALFDVGVYPVAITTHLLQAKPESIHSKGFLTDDGVDENAAFVMKFEQSLVTARISLSANMENQAVITGENGRIIIPPRFWESKSATLIKENATRTEDLRYRGPGLQFEAAHVQECIRQNLNESTIMPLSESLLNMMIVEEISHQLGIRHPKSIKTITGGFSE